jgi:hypothetical protein
VVILRRVLCGLAAASMAAGTVSAVASTDPESTVVDQLIVTARQPGPAWWRVSSPTSVVYVLGVPGALPKGQAWNTSVVERRLKGANEVIGPPTVAAGAGDTLALLGILNQLHTKDAMEDSLPPALKARFEVDRSRLGGDPRTYSHWMPAVAGLQMVSDYRRKADIDAAEPAKTVRHLAEHDGVRLVPAATYKALPLFKAIASQAGQVGPACLSDALDEIEAGPAPVRVAAEGWARGDVRAALAEQRGYEKCANSFPGGAELTRLAMRDTVGAIAGALAKPGHSLALVSLRALLAPGGVLQQLQARGFKVEKPDIVGD